MLMSLVGQNGIQQDNFLEDDRCIFIFIGEEKTKIGTFPGYLGQKDGDDKKNTRLRTTLRQIFVTHRRPYTIDLE